MIVQKVTNISFIPVDKVSFADGQWGDALTVSWTRHSDGEYQIFLNGIIIKNSFGGEYFGSGTDAVVVECLQIGDVKAGNTYNVIVRTSDPTNRGNYADSDPVTYTVPSTFVGMGCPSQTTTTNTITTTQKKRK